MGTLEALYWMTSGGVVPGGSWRNLGLRDGRDLRHRVADVDARLEEDLMTEMPFSDCDSMCSMSLTVVVSERSLSVTMRSAICSGEKPW